VAQDDINAVFAGLGVVGRDVLACTRDDVGTNGMARSIMRKTFLMLVAVVVVIAGDGLTRDAAADGLTYKKVRHVHRETMCGYYPCRPAPCPDKYACWSLYGAYGPYGGAAYWSRYTYAGWGYGW